MMNSVMNDLTLFLAAAMRAATPLLYATLGETLGQRAGQMNLGVEGMMLMGAAVGFMTGLATNNAFLAILAAMAAGALGALIYAFLTVSLRANQVVSGLTLTIFGTGFARFMGQSLIGQVMSPAFKAQLPVLPIPLLSKIPYIGAIFFNHDLLVYISYLLAVFLGIYVFKTRAGLNLRTVGENPGAADAAGIPVSLVKYLHCLMGGALCGLAGAYLSLLYVPSWQDTVTAGRGWIAVALVIFSVWNPYRAAAGALMFGGLDIIGFRLQKYQLPIPSIVFDALPYLVTVVALVMMSMRRKKENQPPAGLGNPYFREER